MGQGVLYVSRQQRLEIRDALVIIGMLEQLRAVEPGFGQGDAKANSSVAGDGERRVTPASLLPSPEPSAADRVVISPGQKLELRWVVKLNDSPLSRGWIGYVNIKCVYINPHKHKQGVMWRGEQLVSNSVERYYFSEPD